ncbi:MAG: hypothetical protein FWF44_09045 [Defluviitaleaceae bacterium]|nr:hypothetical protein [Defluviitaleaceae bacterium]
MYSYRDSLEYQFVPLEAEDPAGRQVCAAGAAGLERAGEAGFRQDFGHRPNRRNGGSRGCNRFGPGEIRASAPNIIQPYAPPEGLPARPPEYTPGKAAGRPADLNGINGCEGKSVYIWLKNGAKFWFYPTYAGKRSLSGYRWTRAGWIFSGVILDWIDFFQSV